MSSQRESSRQGNRGAQHASFDARLVDTEGEMTVAVYGEIDRATSSCLWMVMERAISLGPRLVLDLAGATFIGSTGLNLIVRAHRRLGQLREAIVIRGMRPAARRVFSITGIDQLVTIEEPSDAVLPDYPTPTSTGQRMEKRPADGSDTILVTFRLPAVLPATTVSVVGEFNDWSADAHLMQREDDAYTAVIPLMPGRAYRFRYVIDGERWLNDWSADAYVPNEFGGDDSLVDLRDISLIERPVEGATVEVARSIRS